MPVNLHPHQVEGVAKLHNGCILYGDVGVGKTITSLAYYFTKVCGGELNKWGSMQTPKDVYVITTAKVRDSKGFELQAAQFGVHTDPTISTNGVKITVDSWNNLKKYTEVTDAFFIFDEQRVVGYGAWARAFIKIARANEWILLSATPGDTWLDYIPVFIANGWYKHKTDFIDQHVIWTPRVKYPKVMRYQNVNKLVKQRNQVLVKMPYERHTIRHPVYIKCDYDVEAFDKVVKKRWHVFENRPLRDVAELFGVMRKVVNSDPSRLTELQRLMQKHPKLIVFYNFDYELEMLRTLGKELEWQSSNGSTSGNGSTTPASTTESSTSPWNYLLSPERMVASCPGHWTEDQGNGEEFYRCHPKVPGSPCLSTTTDSTRSSRGLRKSATAQPQQMSLKVSADSANSAEPNSDASSISSDTSTPETSSATATKKEGQTFSVAEWNGHKHQEIPKTDSWLYLVQYRAGAEGWNCVETDAIVFWSQTYSYRDWHQAHGRIDRLNTPFTDLWYYHFISSSVIDKAIRAALRVKKNFNERDLAI